MKRLTRSLALSAAAALSFGLAACGDDDESSPASGTTGSEAAELTVYSGRDEELVAPLFERFETETGTKLSVRYGDTAELAATIREEGENSPADVFFGQDAGALGALDKDGLLAKLPAAALDPVAQEFRSANDTWVGTSGRARVLAYDSRELKEADLPASVLDLTGPEWKGKIGWAPTNASFQAFVTALRKVEGDDVAEQWLKDMDANGAKAYEKNGLVRDAIANGEIQAGLINHYYVLDAASSEGDDYPVKLHFFPGGDTGALVNVAGGGVLKSSEQQEAAASLLTFLLADEQQKFFVDETFEYPLAGDTAAPAGIPAIDSIEQPDVDLADLDDLAGTLELIEKSGVL
ncbi:MAG: iron ABC transporter substrate-binding protein [Solirubrobacteraceae bacterium]|nr:iron ABC transporter substrate-binding protein [Solirubrobacteraceae bacterium]